MYNKMLCDSTKTLIHNRKIPPGTLSCSNLVTVMGKSGIQYYSQQNIISAVITTNFVAQKHNDQELILESYPDEAVLCDSKCELNEDNSSSG
jgi:hypothetical protein